MFYLARHICSKIVRWSSCTQPTSVLFAVQVSRVVATKHALMPSKKNFFDLASAERLAWGVMHTKCEVVGRWVSLPFSAGGTARPVETVDRL